MIYFQEQNSVHKKNQLTSTGKPIVGHTWKLSLRVIKVNHVVIKAILNEDWNKCKISKVLVYRKNIHTKYQETMADK